MNSSCTNIERVFLSTTTVVVTVSPPARTRTDSSKYLRETAAGSSCPQVITTDARSLCMSCPGEYFSSPLGHGKNNTSGLYRIIPAYCSDINFSSDPESRYISLFEIRIGLVYV